MIFDKKKCLLYRKVVNGLCMKRLLYIILCFFTFVSSSKLSARSKLINSPVYQEGYSWETTDTQQKKQAIGMTVTGIVFFFLIAIVSGAIEPSAGEKTTPSTGPSTENTIIS